MKIELIKNKPVNSNSYIIFSEKIQNCIVVDPGTKNCEALMAFFEQKKVSPEYIILTHEHFDHVWGVNKLIELYSCTVICSKNCYDLISDVKKNLSIFHDQIGFSVILKNVILVSNFEFKWNTIFIKFKETVGHSNGSISFWFKNNLFTGDLLIKNNKTITKLPGGDKKKVLNSLDFIEKNFDHASTVVYPGHGDKFYLSEIDFKSVV